MKVVITILAITVIMTVIVEEVVQNGMKARHEQETSFINHHD